MKTNIQGTTLTVAGIAELSATSSTTFRDQTRAALTAAVTTLDIDLSLTTFVDSSGLGSLIALHKTMAGRGGALRIIKPTPTVVQILELTRLHRILEIVS
ncbi:MAG: STAS domain-containing protein [Verrucomicrobia bacterium]|nr:STAS domain-containing protein [Verrucomicrobiota bacterium]